MPINFELEAEKIAYDLVRDLDKDGAIRFCHIQITNKRNRINDLEYYDSEIVKSLDDSINGWALVLNKIQNK